MSFQNYFQKFNLILIFLYLALGNLPRVIPFGNLPNNLPITEFLVYFFLIIYSLLNFRELFLCIQYCLFPTLIIITSFLIGLEKNGFDIQPLLYAIRLILLISTANLAGIILFKYFKLNLLALINFLCATYLLVFLISITIYIIFPESTIFWSYLSNYGIEFKGDPHEHRLVSTYLDPNFYSGIASLPIILCYYAFRRSGKTIFLFYILLFTISIILTGSRSGLVTLILISIFSINWNLFLKKKFSKKTLKVFVIGIFIFLAASPLYLSALQKAFDRFQNISSDDSALFRFQSWQFGFELFLNNPLLGVGYNYLSILLQNFNEMTSLDSSILSTITTFGIILSIAILLLLTIAILQLRINFRRFHDPLLKKLVDLFIVYLIIIFIFTSQFNNFLYYPFWLFPVMMLFTYLDSFGKLQCKRSQ